MKNSTRTSLCCELFLTMFKIGAFTFGGGYATLGVCLPSFAIIYMISLFFDEFLSLTYVAYAFKGIQVCVVYLILTAGLKLMRELEKNLFNSLIIVGVIAAMILCSLFAVKFSSIFYILICGMIGIFVFGISSAVKKGGNGK